MDSLKRKILIGIGILAALAVPAIGYAINITVPSAPGAGYWLYSTSTGAYQYVASSSADFGGTWQGFSPSHFNSGLSTTTINGAQCPVFTFSINGTSSPSSITTSTCTIFFNLLEYSSGTDINVAANGTINFVNPGFLSAAITSINGATSSAQTIVGSGLISATITKGSSNSTTTISCPTCGTSNVSTSSSNTWGGTQSFTNPANFNGITNNGNETTTNLTANSGLKLPFATSTILATDANGNVIATTTPSGGTPAGTSTDIQFNNGGTFGADTGNFTYNSSTHQLGLKNVSSSEVIGTQFASSTKILSFSSASSTVSWTSPFTDSVVVTAVGAGGTSGANGANGGAGGTATGTIAVTKGTTYYIHVGGTCETPGQALTDVGGCGGGPTWFSTANTLSTSTVLVMAGGGGGGGAQANGQGATIPNGGYGGGVIGGSAGNSSTGASGGVGGTNGSGGGGGQGFNTGSGPNGSIGAGGGGGGSVGLGGAAASGGGGADWFGVGVTSTSTATSSAVNTGNGSLTIAYSSLNNSQNTSLSVGGHIVTGGSSPSLSSCGTSPSVSGNDTAGVITTGTGTVNSCTLTFANPYVTAPVPTANLNVNATTYISAVSSSAVTFSFSASSPSDKLYYHILGY